MFYPYLVGNGKCFKLQFIYRYTAFDRQFANACQEGHMERLAEGQLVNQLYVPSSICHTLQYQEIFCSPFEKENSH